MISRRRLIAGATVSGVPAAALTGLAQPAAAAGPGTAAGDGDGPEEEGALHVTGTTTEYADRPLGLDTPHPRLSWTLGSRLPDRLQHAYRIRVAGDPARLHDPDVWDSGKRTSRQSVLVPYDGPPLRPGTRYHWSVRVWDEDGHPSPWSAPTWWETGLTAGGQGRWRAEWITAPPALVAPPAPEGAEWIWFPEGDAASEVPAGTRWFRGTTELPDGIRRARLVIAADNGFTAWVNGTEVASHESHPVRKSWSRPALLDVTRELRPGANTVAVAAVNSEAGPAGLLAALEAVTEEGVTGEDDAGEGDAGEGGSGEIRRFTTDGTWRAADEEPGGDWRSPGYDDSSWARARKAATWGEDPWGKVLPEQSPAQLRRAFRLPSRGVAAARLHITALGLYEAHLNGTRVGEDRLTPGWTDYGKRVAYRTYDVTGSLRHGANALAVTLAPGWYAGNIGWFGQHQYGEHPALLAQLEVSYEDGSTARVTTDADWRASAGPLVTADLLMGEEYDARAETPGWQDPGYDDARWEPVAVSPAGSPGPDGSGGSGPGGGSGPAVVAMTDAPTRVMRRVAPVKVTEVRPGAFLFDLGQNMVGCVRLTVTGGEAGRRIRLRHGEVLDREGALYTDNLRTARAVDTFTLKGPGREVHEPRFTFHGFRYVEVTGYPGTPPRDAVTGLVMHTSAPSTMDFSTDDPMLNKLHGNITRGQRGNFLSVPTDTPARDERLGWSGDINVFAPTAAYTMESARFLTKWLQDLRDGQDEDGAYPDVAPFTGQVGKGVAGWGDAGVTVPWALHEAYGDVRVLRENWPAMRRWIAYLEAHSDGLLRPAEGYGDWLNVGDETPKDVIGTAYFAHATSLVARTARLLGEDAGPYERLHRRIEEAFGSAYVREGGARIKGDTQTAYVLALSMDLLPTAAAKRAAADRLVELIEAHDSHLTTGFLGTPRLLPALTDAGHIDVAQRLLHRRSFPSWGYQIDRGSTTMWERWDAIRPDGSFQDVEMNSFNHYAYGCVGEWMYRNLGGIAPAEPGFRRTLVRPRPGGGVRRADARHDSPYGPVATSWSLDPGGRFRLTVSLPPNTTGEIWVPARQRSAVRAGGVRFLHMRDGCAVFDAGSGTHRFTAEGG
ncbi:family 78 glycoside hydrolase catalytic domain [Streptomyces sp. HNM0575]|uniref:family 78 glycoside hydrolase catalytic domain n=1 Tax=Streptomyces sp. HNM0575 TaxID=2716338 RepID=UPI00145CF1CB|nr:family 78 glycoside hydrolase catalytic domain [Streptomyces sp. HNM0575]NLU73643.1 family 78 glycoside hydrolase catalytic domain [Streptomyces sp. HNM0575]